MPLMVSLRDASRNLGKYIKAVEVGEEVVITRRGMPVAKLSPMPQKRTLTLEQEAARRRTMQRMRKGWDLGDWKVDRDKLYER